MKKHYVLLFSFFLVLLLSIISCSKSEDDTYTPVPEVSPVTVDLTKVPYQKLSEYKFFEGELKDQKPSLNVLPFAPASSLFTDYAQKKRFVWMPDGTQATYISDKVSLDLPVGAALVKTFYYDNVQNISPAGGTRILETRVMIKKADGWIFAEYVWNDEQTEAYYDMEGSFTQISWKDANGLERSTDYRLPSLAQCIVCHKSHQTVNGVTTVTNIPIGIKPQNLNFDYNYGNTTQNQLQKWVEMGYLNSNFTPPTAQNSTVNYADASQPVGVRARSYVDINCAHCHQTERHCDYRPMRYAFSETAENNANMGVCVNTQDMQGFPTGLSKIVTPRNTSQSMMYYRLNTTNETYRMPLHGRTIIHDEGLALMREWIGSLQACE
ncbi:MAG: hypothetical protein EOP46_21335 [Sphingobacteriaceae bacterium]|nr:MAG: hypothetical protein EOP46_21335 [Sphingobacteriaceae bacterium]